MSISWSSSMPDAYERLLVPMLFEPYARDLVRRVAAHSPSSVLELAAGTGVVTRLMTASIDAEITATDVSDAMIAFGRTQAPIAQWQHADALDLPFEDNTFDAVVCEFGAMFFPDRRLAFSEARRVLRAGGTFHFNVWGSVGENPFAAAVQSGLDRAVGERLPFLGVPYGYNDRSMIEADVRGSGFEHVEIDTLVFEGRAASAADVAAGYCDGTPLRAALEARGDADALVAIVADEVAQRLGDGEVTGTLTAHVIQAR